MDNPPLPPPDLPLIYSGKVRDLYRVDPKHLLIVATDRLSAFDVVLPDPIPGKGEVLTSMAMFWFKRFADLIANHVDLASLKFSDLVAQKPSLLPLKARSMLVKETKPLRIEAIVRGYVAGSGWVDYQRDGAISNITLPRGLRQAEKLPEPLFTPSTKAPLGDHDQTISFADAANLVGRQKADAIRSISLDIYQQAAQHALDRGIIIADTKFEFGIDHDDNLLLIDEILTPDSSRFWPADQYTVGVSPVSLDKQFVRDYLLTQEWDKTPPGPRLPKEIIAKTAEIYRTALRRLTT